MSKCTRRCAQSYCFKIVSMFLLFFCVAETGSVKGDVSEYFLGVQGDPNGQFVWDDFAMVNGSFVGPHAPDTLQQGVGDATLTANEGVLITSTGNLYSPGGPPTWTIDLSGLYATAAFTSIGTQFVVSGDYAPAQFSIAGAAPTEFSTVALDVNNTGFGGYNVYWVEWQGLVASSNYQIQTAGTSAHQALGGTKVSYFNTDSSFNISAVPEPSAVVVLIAGLGSVCVRRRRVR